MQRSGTTVTNEYLAGHPAVAIASEEIHTALFQAAITDPSSRGETTDERTASLRQVLDYLAGRSTENTAGLKTALNSPAATARLVGCLLTHGHGVDLIVVRRRDVVAQLGSLRRAMQLGIWHTRSADQPQPTLEPITIDPDELRDYVDLVHSCHALLDLLAAGRRVLELDYQDDIATGTAWPRLCEFLQVPPAEPTWMTLRKNSPPPQNYIANYDELTERLPDLLAAAAVRPAPEATFDDNDSRVFSVASRPAQKGT